MSSTVGPLAVRVGDTFCSEGLLGRQHTTLAIPLLPTCSVLGAPSENKGTNTFHRLVF